MAIELNHNLSRTDIEKLINFYDSEANRWAGLGNSDMSNGFTIKADEERSRLSLLSLKIVTTYVYPPIPDRRFDWSAHYEGREEEGPYGWGRTESEACLDLIENYDIPSHPTT